MTGEHGPAVRNVNGQDLNQPLEADVTRERQSFSRLTVEFREVIELGAEVAQGNAEALTNLEGDGANRFAHMDMLVGIDVIRKLAQQGMKSLELARNFGLDGVAIIEGNDRI